MHHPNGEVSSSAEPREPDSAAIPVDDAASADENAAGESGVTDPVDDSAVEEALRELGMLDRIPVHQHADVIEKVHRALQDRLAEPE